ncbi:MAG: hypothetical protein KF745_03600 [Phycisphaeraceae bacterium]|nr:hypothetical protein [Phycisphaeraceae bacterium]
MKNGSENVTRLNASWGDSLMNKLPSRSRKRRKREASKKRRVRSRQSLSAE